MAQSGMSSGSPALSLPTTPGPATPGINGAPSPSPFNRVSLPGQQKSAPATPSVSGLGATAAGANSSGGPSTSGTSGAASKSSTNATEKVNYDNITDVMGYVGVDLKEESDNIMRDNDGYSKSGGHADGQDRTRVQNFMNAKLLKTVVEKIGKERHECSISPSCCWLMNDP